MNKIMNITIIDNLGKMANIWMIAYPEKYLTMERPRLAMAGVENKISDGLYLTMWADGLLMLG